MDLAAKQVAREARLQAKREARRAQNEEGNEPAATTAPAAEQPTLERDNKTKQGADKVNT